MALKTILAIKENWLELQQLLRKQPIHLQPRIKMLQLIVLNSTISTTELSSRLFVTTRTIQLWKKDYKEKGITHLLT